MHILKEMEDITLKTQKMEMELAEYTFMNCNNFFQEGKTVLKIEDGHYIIYVGEDVDLTFKDFTEAYNRYKKLTR